MVALGLLPQDAGVVAGVETGLVLGPRVPAVVALAPVHHAALQLQLDVILLDAMNLTMEKYKISTVILESKLYPVEMTVETILTCILFATLRTNNVCVLVLEMNILDVALQGHFMEIWRIVNLDFR